MGVSDVRSRVMSDYIDMVRVGRVGGRVARCPLPAGYWSGRAGDVAAREQRKTLCGALIYQRAVRCSIAADRVNVGGLLARLYVPL